MNFYIKNWTDTKLIYFLVILNVYNFNFSFIKLRVLNYALQSNGLKVLEVIKIYSKTCVRNLKFNSRKLVRIYCRGI